MFGPLSVLSPYPGLCHQGMGQQAGDSQRGFHSSASKGCLNNPNLLRLPSTSHLWVSFFQAGRWKGSRRRISGCCLQQHCSPSPPLRDFLCLTDQCQSLPSPGGCKCSLSSVLQFDRHSHRCLLTPSTSLQNPGLLHHVKVMDEEELYPADSNLSLFVLKGSFTSDSY